MQSGRIAKTCRAKMYKSLNLYIMHTLALSELRAEISAMIDLVQKGEVVRILRHGKPVADLVPVQQEPEDRAPAWKRADFEPLRVARPDGKSGAQMIIDEREGGW